jgi:NADH dehydrogenase
MDQSHMNFLTDQLPKTVLLIGGSGFIGSALATQLAYTNMQVLIPCRRPALSALRVLPNATLIQANVNDEQQLAALCARLQPHDAVVNLTGILHGQEGQPYGPEFRQIHVDLPRNLIAAMHQHGLRRLLHISALGAASDGASMYQRSKGDGEQLVKQSGLDWTVFRPSVVFGRHDHFINLFAKMQKFLPVVPLAGANVRFQPVFVGDVSEAILRSLSLSATIGQVCDLAGPDIYTLRQLVEFAGRLHHQQRPILPLPASLAWLQAMIMEHVPGPTLLSRDNLRSMRTDNILPPNAPNCLNSTFGLRPTALHPSIWL